MKWKILLGLLIILSASVFAIEYPSTVKVLLSTELSSWGSSKGYAFEKVVIKSTRPFTIKSGDFEKTFVNGETVLTAEGDKVLVKIADFEKTLESKVALIPQDFKAKFTLVNAKRKLGSPVYPGKLIIKNIDGKLYVVNEVSIEEYVKRVVPSEMPASFPKEALKAQAVAARSVAVLSALNPQEKFLKYGADVDDSILSQVYNNVEFTSVIEDAVSETEGLIMFYEGKIIEQLNYFSTSSGFTANAEEVWAFKDKFPGKPIPFLKSQPQFENLKVPPKFADGKGLPDIQREDVARWFFKMWKLPEGSVFYDSQSPWFRWKVTLSQKQLQNIISKTIPQREKADKILNADFIQVKSGMKPDDPDFSTGEIYDLNVIKRGHGGNVMIFEIVAENGTWWIYKEYNIRFVIRPRKDFAESDKDIVLHLYDGTTWNNYSILPSAFFIMDIERDLQGNLVEVTFWGGGNGHGVGMSQYGAKFMGSHGYGYEDILKRYYYGVKIKKVY
ncbi:MAG: SpoIID/LytB domain-containing protein [Thermotogaceae bacterium]|nr:SpoIID/LytB domain-containing protein [Thermotogaceae bacterium]